MSKAAPWSITGIDYDMRSAAKQAARRAGMTLGEWLNNVIADQAIEMGLEPEDFDETDRRQAIATKLERISGKERHYSRRGDRPDAAHAFGADDDFDDTDEFPDAQRKPRRPRPHEVSFDNPRPGRLRQTNRYRPGERDRFDPDQLIDEAVGKMERRSRINTRETGAAVEMVQRRLANIEDALEMRAGNSDDKAVRRALSRLEARLEALAARAEPDEATSQISELDRKLAAIAAKLTASPAPTPLQKDTQAEQTGKPVAGMRPSEMARIEAKLNLLLARESTSASATNSVSQPVSSHPTLSDAVAEISMRQQMLDGAADAPTSLRPPPSAEGHFNRPADLAGKQAVAAVRNDLHTLSARIEDLRRENADRNTAQIREQELTRQQELARQEELQRAQQQRDRQPHPALEQLRVQMAEVNQAVSELAPKNSIALLEAAVRDLSTKVNNSRQEGVREGILQPIERLIGDLKTSLGSHTAIPQLDTIERELQNIATRLEHLGGANGRIDDSRLDEIYQQTSAIRDLLSAAVSRPMPVDAIEQQLSALGQRIDLIASRGSSPAGAAAVNENVNAIRSAFAESFPGQELSAIQAKIEALSAKFDEAIAGGPSLARIEDISERIDAVQRTIFQRLDRPANDAEQSSRKLEGLMREIRDRLDISTRSERQDQTNTLEAQIQSLSEKFETSNRAPDLEQLSALERHIRALADKLDTPNPAPDSNALAALEAQVREIAERIDHPNASLEMLGNIELNMASLVNQLEETRLAAADAAEAAARKATQEAMGSLLKQDGRPVNNKDAINELLTRELSSIRSSQDATDRRTHATLSAVHETLEKVVDRLAMLEDNIDRRPAVQTASAAPAVPVAATLASGPAPLFQRKPADDAPDSKAGAPVAAASMTDTFTAPPPGPTAPSMEVPKQRNAFTDAQQVIPPLLPRDAAVSQRENDPARAKLSQSLKIDPEASTLWQDADEDDLLEPGSGIPSDHTYTRRAASVREEPEFDTGRDDSDGIAVSKSSSSFIAAARRASIAAQAQAEANSSQTSRRREKGSKDGTFADARARAAAAAATLAGSLDRKNGLKNSPASQDNSESTKMDSAVARGDPRTAGSARAGLRNRKVLLSLGLAAAVLGLGTWQFLRNAQLPVFSAPQLNNAIEKPPMAKPAKPAAAKDASGPQPPEKPLLPGKLQQGAGLPTGFNRKPGVPVAIPNTFVKTPGVVNFGYDTDPVATLPAQSTSPGPSKTSRNLEEAALAGNAGAQYELAIRHIAGRTIARDTRRAVELLKKSAAQGLAPAQYRLASMYEKGVGTGKNSGEALRLYGLAANAGNIRAMHNLAVLAADGTGGKPDYTKAAQWFKKAAEHGVRDSQFNLAILYARGLGTARNLVESYKWFAIAAAQGDKDAASKRDQVAKRLTSAESIKARRAVKNFTPRSGNTIANSVAAPQGGWTMGSPQVSAPPAVPSRKRNGRSHRNVSSL